MTVWFVPRDAAALSVGADAVAAALEALGEQVVRTGSRGLLWLEPLVERADSRNGTRVDWANVRASDLRESAPADTANNFLGVVEELDYLACQNRWIYERVGINDPVDPDDYLSHGGMAGLQRALELSPASVIEQVTESGLRGRGGAGGGVGRRLHPEESTQTGKQTGDGDATDGSADHRAHHGEPGRGASEIGSRPQSKWYPCQELDRTEQAPRRQPRCRSR